MKQPCAWFGLASFALASVAAAPLQVVLDDAWGGANGSHFSGRLVETRAVADASHGGVRTLYRNTRLILADGEEGSVTWRVAGCEWTLRADDSGYWELATNQPLPLAPGWHAIESEPPASGPAGLLIPDPANRFGIVSDVDDTILVSEVLDKTTLLRNSLSVPAARREAVPGMADLYRRLLATKNPAPETSVLFYVSASPRQLTDNLRGFLHARDFPRGVLHLKEISEASDDSLLDQRAYKLRVIETVLHAYPDVRFALFGDDGEKDPEIYAALQEKFPARIEGVWIRRVDPNPDRARFAGQRDLAELLAP